MYFSAALGVREPVTSLTVKGSELAFAQVERYHVDATGAHVGMRVKTFGPTGASRGGGSLHYVVIAKPDVSAP